MNSYELHKIESVSEVDNMKLERGFVGLGLVLVINYMMHQMFAPGIYLGAVMSGLLVYYGHVNVETMMKQGIVRFILVLLISLLMEETLGFIESVNWLVLCVLCAAVSQRIQKSSMDFLENLSIINMILCGICFCGILLQLISPVMLMIVSSLLQPSGLSLRLEETHFLQLKR